MKKWRTESWLGLWKLAEFLNKRKIFTAKDIPYKSQLVPLAAIFASLGNDGKKIGIVDKITRWYWCGVFGEMYAGSTDTQAATDFSEVVDWVKGKIKNRQQYVIQTSMLIGYLSCEVVAVQRFQECMLF